MIIFYQYIIQLLYIIELGLTYITFKYMHAHTRTHARTHAHTHTRMYIYNIPHINNFKYLAMYIYHNRAYRNTRILRLP